MKKLLTIVASAFILTLCGCAGKSTAVASDIDMKGKDVSTYLVGEYLDVKTSQSKLEEAGFEVIAAYKSVEQGTTIVFTNEALKAEGAKPRRAYASILRLFVDEKEKMISITNPIYFGRAYMQEEYNNKVFSAQLEAINKAFSGLKPSVDKLNFDDLAHYRYTIMNPYYEGVLELGKGEQSTLVEKARNYKKGKLLLFELKLSETSTLMGYDLDKRTKKFVEKIGRANGAVLPYCISIENGAATALHGEYYLALSYPLLSMGTFMTIATVPGAIKKDLEKPFK
jgi:hypothetical protein